MNCIECHQPIDPLGLVGGRCHGCRVEHEYYRHMSYLKKSPARGRNKKCAAFLNPARRGVGQVQHLAGLGLPATRGGDRHHPNLPYKVMPSDTEAARLLVEILLPDYENIPLVPLTKQDSGTTP